MNQPTPKISIISPVYQAEKIIDKLIEQITIQIEKITQDYEIILVEDGSPDNSWEKIEQACSSNPRVKGIKLSRNFGQHPAITCGIEVATGDYAIIMDCDLQDNPIYFKDLYKKISEGYDIVYTIKEKRKHSFFKNITATLFNRVFNWLVDNKNIKGNNNIGSYSMISQKVIDDFIRFGDYRRHYLNVLRWLGYNSGYVKIEHNDRFEGKSSYNFIKLINHAIDGITSQSDKLLRLNIYIGFSISLAAFLWGIFIIIRSYLSPYQAGWASVMVLILFVTGLLLISMGILGIYIGKVFEQVKRRPIYLIDKILNK